jgi:hypothetical protein
MNEMAWSYLSIGAKVWMLDLGRSFEKLCRKAEGTYIEFRPDVEISLNPFLSRTQGSCAPFWSPRSIHRLRTNMSASVLDMLGHANQRMQ